MKGGKICLARKKRSDHFIYIVKIRKQNFPVSVRRIREANFQQHNRQVIECRAL